MADYTIPVAPFLNVVFYITDTFWSDRGGTPHRGLDIDPSGSQNYPLYSMIDGVVIDKGSNSSAGNYLIIKDDNDPNGLATRYLHLNEPALVNIGDRVTRFQLVGYEGRTGQATGIHLHLEMKNLYGTITWRNTNVKSDYIDPAEWMGIPNRVGVSAICEGVIPPPTPTEENEESHFPWVLYAEKLRNSY